VSDAPLSSFIDRHYFLLRRLHSLSGVVPIGAFLLPHLTTNSSIVWGHVNGSHLDAAQLAELERAGVAVHAGVETFQHEVDFIHGLPFLILIEIAVLWLPIAFHAGLGLVYAFSGRPNTVHYGYQDNWRYTLQRISGYIGVLFIFMHLASLRWGWTFGGLFPVFVPEAASSSTAVHFQDGPLGVIVPLFYLIAVLGLVFHFANGLWTAAITWGLTISVAAQRRWGYVCAGLGLALGVMTVLAVAGFTFLDVDQAREIERLLSGAEGGVDVAAESAAAAPTNG
jgi:succinate dehydrogenase / fumarate reductase cytochrome b subunit